MDDLDAAIGLILADFSTPAHHRLMTDCWALGQKYGESEGLRYAAMYLRCFEDFERDRRVRRSFRTHTADREAA